MDSKPIREIRAYMSFGRPIDPAKVYTLVDLDFSYALASTLVDLNDSKEPCAGLADSWRFSGEKEITFHLDPKAAWSDGTHLTADDVVESLARAKRQYREELKSLFDLVESVRSHGPTDIVFKLNVVAAGSGILKKLTEPMYGVLAVKKDGAIDFTKTTGPYLLSSSTDMELRFMQNDKWLKAQPKMAESIVIRQPPPGEELQLSFLEDGWVNLLTTSSLAPESVTEEYNSAHYSIWRRSLDKVFFMSPGPRLSTDSGRALVRFLNQKLDRARLTKGLSGLKLSDQFFVPGYVLFDPEFRKSANEEKIPASYAGRPLEVLGIAGRLSALLESNLSAAIKKITGVAPHIKTVPLADIDKARAGGDYDFLVASLPVNDANVEGALGYIFGMTPPFIPNAGEFGAKNFHERIVNSKQLHDQAGRNAEYRKVFSDAINDGCILPLFHFSTIVIAKKGIDLSRVPTTDETVAFSKVRFP